MAKILTGAERDRVWEKVKDKPEGYRVEFHGPSFDIELGGELSTEAFWVLLSVYAELMLVDGREDGED